MTWYWQLQGHVHDSARTAAYDLDGSDTPAREIARLHAQGRHVICYIDVGTWENWRPDARTFPRSALGKPNGWPGERWLDIRRANTLQPIMLARFRICARKRFDAIEPDNIDGYANDSGFRLTGREQLRHDKVGGSGGPFTRDGRLAEERRRSSRCARARVRRGLGRAVQPVSGLLVVPTPT